MKMELFLDDGILIFDGEILELFAEKGSSSRYHIKYLIALEFSSGRKGITLLDLRYGKGGGFLGYIIPEENMGQANKLMEAVQTAKSKL